MRGENEHDSVRIRMGVCARWARFVGATRGDPNVEAGEALTKRGHSNRICVILADFDRPKLQILHWNMKFGQNKSCRGRKNLQLCFWAKVELKLGSETKTRSNTAKPMFIAQTRLTLTMSLSP